jgi:hypothetical protein
MTKEEILKEFRIRYGELSMPTLIPPSLVARGTFNPTAQIAKWLSSVLDRYALSIVEQSVPEETAELEYANTSAADRYAQGFNTARERTLEKARSLTNQPA